MAQINSFNVNGLSSYIKQNFIYDHIIENQIDIFGLSETHLSLKESKFLQLSKNLINYQNF